MGEKKNLILKILKREREKKNSSSWVGLERGPPRYLMTM